MFELVKVNEVLIIRVTRSLTIFDVDDINSPLPDLPKDVKGAILDLTSSEEIDSFGVSIIVRIMSFFKSLSKKFFVVAKENKVMYILRIDKIDKIIPIYESIDEALKQF
jgi:anti-anti-sigma factor